MEPVTLGSGRSYLLFRPQVAGPVPLVLMLHGTGGSAAFAADETGLAAFAAAEGFAVAFPDGLPVKPHEPARFLTNPQRWNDGSTRHGDLLHSDTDDVGYLTEVVFDAIQRANADPARVYLTGFSNGAGMAFRFAAERAELLAAVAPLAGYCHLPEPRPIRPVPTLYIVGDSDLLIPLHGGTVRLPWGNRTEVRPPVSDTLAKWATAIGCRAKPEESLEDRMVRAVFPPLSRFALEFAAVVVHGLGHHWPGGKGQFNPRLGGPTSDRLDGNREIWSFFRRHRLQ